MIWRPWQGGVKTIKKQPHEKRQLGISGIRLWDHYRGLFGRLRTPYSYRLSMSIFKALPMQVVYVLIPTVIFLAVYKFTRLRLEENKAAINQAKIQHDEAYIN